MTSEAQTVTAPAARGWRHHRGANLFRRCVQVPELGPTLALVIIYLFFVVTGHNQGYVSVVGTASWLNTASQLGIIAVPVGLLLLAGEFDLSIGSMVGAGSITVGIVSGTYQDSIALAIVAGLVLGILVGLGNGLLVVRTRMPSFIVTLAANLIVAALALALSSALTGTSSISITATGFLTDLFGYQFGQFDVSIIWWAVVVVLATWVMARTRYGSWILATGGHGEKARRAGVVTSRVKIVLFICTAVASTFVGMIQAIQFHTGDPTVGQEYVFQAPVVVVIGGVLLTGGYGTIPGVAVGTMIYGVVDAGVFYTGWDTNLTDVILGGLLLIAVLTNNYVRKAAISTISARREHSR